MRLRALVALGLGDGLRFGPGGGPRGPHLLVLSLLSIRSATGLGLNFTAMAQAMAPLAQAVALLEHWSTMVSQLRRRRAELGLAD